MERCNACSTTSLHLSIRTCNIVSKHNNHKAKMQILQTVIHMCVVLYYVCFKCHPQTYTEVYVVQYQT